MRYRYVGTPDPMSQREQYHCEKYMKRNKANMLEAGAYLVDVAALRTLFHLDCGNCRTVHRQTCCEGGQPYAVEPHQAALLDREIPAIAGYFAARGWSQHWAQKPVWDERQRAGTLRLEHEKCVFFQEMNGQFGCAVHAYAEQTGGELDVKPFSCRLYPLDLIDTGEAILLTAVTEETAPFSRWGSDYLEQFYCASLSRRQLAIHLDEQHFAIEGYRPAYTWNLPLLRYLLQAEAERVEAMLQGHDNDAWQEHAG